MEMNDFLQALFGGLPGRGPAKAPPADAPPVPQAQDFGQPPAGGQGPNFGVAAPPRGADIPVAPSAPPAPVVGAAPGQGSNAPFSPQLQAAVAAQPAPRPAAAAPAPPPVAPTPVAPPAGYQNPGVSGQMVPQASAADALKGYVSRPPSGAPPLDSSWVGPGGDMGDGVRRVNPQSIHTWLLANPGTYDSKMAALGAFSGVAKDYTGIAAEQRLQSQGDANIDINRGTLGVAQRGQALEEKKYGASQDPEVIARNEMLDFTKANPTADPDAVDAHMALTRQRLGLPPRQPGTGTGNIPVAGGQNVPADNELSSLDPKLAAELTAPGVAEKLGATGIAKKIYADKGDAWFRQNFQAINAFTGKAGNNPAALRDIAHSGILSKTAAYPLTNIQPLIQYLMGNQQRANMDVYRAENVPFAEDMNRYWNPGDPTNQMYQAIRDRTGKPIPR